MLMLLLLGLPFGMLMLAFLPERPLKICLGLFMIYVAIKGLVECYFPYLGAQSKQKPTGWRKWIFDGFVFLGGIMQGAFICGGPFVVIYAKTVIKDKDQFRMTLFAIWLTINSIITLKNIAVGAVTEQVLLLTAVTLPFWVLSVVFSQAISQRINGQIFAKALNGVILIAGFFMLR